MSIAVTDVNDAPPTFTSGTSADVAENVAAHDHAERSGRRATALRRLAARTVFSGNGLGFIAKNNGSDGNSISIVFNGSGSGSGVDVNVSGNTITITFRCFTASPQMRGTQHRHSHVADKVNTHEAASALVTASHWGSQLVAITPIYYTNLGSVSLSGGDDEITAMFVYTAQATPAQAGVAVSYALSGTDAALFGIDPGTGDVWFRQAPDFETPGDAGIDNVYDFTVTATAGTLTATQNVALTITDGNDAPTSADAAVTLDEDGAYTFTAGNFTFTDQDSGDTLASITIVTLPGGGTLSLGSDSAHDASTTYTAVAAGAVVAAADIAKLRYVPAADANGTGYDSFTFTVNDGTDDSVAANTITFNVTPVNDAPVLGVETGGTSISDTTSNVADDAGTTVSTSVSEWWGRDGGGNAVVTSTTVRDAHLAALTDGNTSNSATHDSTNYPYAESPVTQFHTVASSAHSVTFDLDGTFATGSIVVWNRNAGSDAHQQRINGTTVELFKDGTSVWTSAALNRTQEDADDKITVTPPANIQFDEVRLNFPGNDQNLREVQIFGAEVTSGATIDAGATQAVSVAENIATSTAVLDFAAVDVDAADTLSYSVSGTDAADFRIDRSTGVLTFAAAPDYETPADADTDNVYNITVSVSDGMP